VAAINILLDYKKCYAEQNTRK